MLEKCTTIVVLMFALLGLMLVARNGSAAPSVQVTYNVDSGLAIWDVLVLPDPQLLAEGQGVTFLQLTVETNQPTAGPGPGVQWKEPFSGNVILDLGANPYTGAAFHGADCYCSVPSQLGIPGNVNALYASLESIDLESPAHTKALSFWTYRANSPPTILKYAGLIAQGTDSDPVHFSGEFEFHPTHRLRDANIDGEINNLDIDHMIIAMSNPGAWEALHPGENILEFMDANFDGVINNLDISNLFNFADYPPPDCPLPSASLLTSQVPEPATMALTLVTGVCAFSSLQRRRYLSLTRRVKGHQT